MLKTHFGTQRYSNCFFNFFWRAERSLAGGRPEGERYWYWFGLVFARAQSLPIFNRCISRLLPARASSCTAAPTAGHSVTIGYYRLHPPPPLSSSRASYRPASVRLLESPCRRFLALSVPPSPMFSSQDHEAGVTPSRRLPQRAPRRHGLHAARR